MEGRTGVKTVRVYVEGSVVVRGFRARSTVVVEWTQEYRGRTSVDPPRSEPRTRVERWWNDVHGPVQKRGETWRQRTK